MLPLPPPVALEAAVLSLDEAVGPDPRVPEQCLSADINYLQYIHQSNIPTASAFSVFVAEIVTNLQKNKQKKSSRLCGSARCHMMRGLTSCWHVQAGVAAPLTMNDLHFQCSAAKSSTLHRTAGAVYRPV